MSATTQNAPLAVETARRSLSKVNRPPHARAISFAAGTWRSGDCYDSTRSGVIIVAIGQPICAAISAGKSALYVHNLLNCLRPRECVFACHFASPCHWLWLPIYLLYLNLSQCQYNFGNQSQLFSIITIDP